ncbi:MAG: MlaE family lipid ABC transporter permease subunit [Betaproteobacteria bacterium]
MAALAISDTSDGRRILALSGRLDATTLPELWDKARRAADESASKPLVVDAADVEYCDGAGVALIVDILRRRHDGGVEVANLKPAFTALLKQFDPSVLEHDLDPEPPRRPAIDEIGFEAYGVWRDLRTQIEFIGETTAALAFAVRHPKTVRWKDVWRICEQVGADALPIVALISVLLGMILAFQSAVPMKRFGAEIFVADLIGLSMLRELGPLMTAILLAGRSGAAFAAEIGTMRVNQEVDALTTMGLSPVRFLVTPRIIAAVLMTPLLTLFSDLVGMIGGALTMRSFSIPIVTFLKEIDSAVTLTDFLAGFVKSFVFAVLVAGIGCLRGLQTKAGASAVGDSATSAVVTGIILLVVVDGVFAVAYYLLNI